MKKFIFCAAFLHIAVAFATTTIDARDPLKKIPLSTSTAPSNRSINEAANFHKYYLSVSNVSYSTKAKALQMVSRYFIDDLEDVLNERMEKRCHWETQTILKN